MDTTDDMHEAMFAKQGCCFFLPCLGSSQPSGPVGNLWWQRIKTVDKLEPDERWWISGWNKMRGSGLKSWQAPSGRPSPAALAAVTSAAAEETAMGHFEDEFPYRDYSTRFTSPSLPVSTKCSIDFDNDNYAPPMIK
ncbi:hypothetical protein Bca101_033611 [Brassica carinata]